MTQSIESQRSPRRSVGGFFSTLYVIGFLLAAPYLNWVYAKEHGFFRWLFLGEVVATAEALVWPYFLGKGIMAIGQPSARSPTPGPLYEAHCKEPLPVFTLNENANPTKEQETALCACIWQSLSGSERAISEKIAQGKESEVTPPQIQAFVPRFGERVRECGGGKL